MRDLIYALCAVIASFCLLAALPAIAEQTTGVFDRVFVDSASDSALDVAGGLAQGGTTLVSASGDLRDNIVRQPELQTATGDACTIVSATASLNGFSFFPSLSGPAGTEATLTWVPGASMEPRLLLAVSPTVGRVGTMTFSPPMRSLAATATELYGLSQAPAPPRLWRIDATDGSASLVGAISVWIAALTEAAAIVGSTLYVAGGPPGDQLWSASLSNPGGAVMVGDFPADLQAPQGMTYVDPWLYIVDTNDDELWRSSLTAPDSATLVGALPAALNNPRGIVAVGEFLYVVQGNPGAGLYRISATHTDTDYQLVVALDALPELTGAAFLSGQLYISRTTQLLRLTSGMACIEWTYVTASDNPRLWVATDDDGVPMALWQAEDPSSTPELSDVVSWTGETYTPMRVDMPPDAILTGLYEGEPVTALRAALAARGWPNDGLTVASLVAGAPRAGCGTPAGDCRPMARLLALRALAEQRGETVFDLVRRATRIAADGTWSLTP